MSIQNTPIDGGCATVRIKFHASNDLGIPFIKDVLQERSSKHHDRLEVHLNALLQPLLKNYSNRRLKRCLPIDLK
jgi:hypothetical protein